MKVAALCPISCNKGGAQKIRGEIVLWGSWSCFLFPQPSFTIKNVRTPCQISGTSPALFEDRTADICKMQKAKYKAQTTGELKLIARSREVFA